MMNGHMETSPSEKAYMPKDESLGQLRSFDAFPKTKSSYTRRTSSGGYATILLIIVSVLLTTTELRRWYKGQESHLFSVQKGVSHQLQINLDIVVGMKCQDLRVNVQDASGDRIRAGDLLHLDPTGERHWLDVNRGIYRLEQGMGIEEQERDTHVGHVLGEVSSSKRKFKKTPRLARGDVASMCRIYGSIEGNKVQGDFHITARGHGYQEDPRFGHLQHEAFNFSHVINELSFGPLYPSLQNPLDKTYASSSEHFYKFQYYLSVVPTIYTRSPHPHPSNSLSRSIFTNQYAVTSQSFAVDETTIPGIFFKFDFEPILLTIMESRGSFMGLLFRLVNVLSGVVVAGGWCFQLYGWVREVFRMGSKSRRKSEGMLHGNRQNRDDDEDDP